MDKLQSVRKKILDQSTLDRSLTYWRFRNFRLVFTNGCFDILHRGHVEYLAKAASLGDILILGLNTDSSVRGLKGESRPLQDEETRSLILASLSFVSALILFDEETPYELIKKVQPDILVKGADYAAQDIVGYDIVMQRGGKVIPIELTQGYSTTSIIDRLIPR